MLVKICPLCGMRNPPAAAYCTGDDESLRAVPVTEDREEPPAANSTVRLRR